METTLERRRTATWSFVRFIVNITTKRVISNKTNVIVIAAAAAVLRSTTHYTHTRLRRNCNTIIIIIIILMITTTPGLGHRRQLPLGSLTPRSRRKNSQSIPSRRRPAFVRDQRFAVQRVFSLQRAVTTGRIIYYAVFL